jgi:hypothetical protein
MLFYNNVRKCLAQMVHVMHTWCIQCTDGALLAKMAVLDSFSLALWSLALWFMLSNINLSMCLVKVVHIMHRWGI